MVVEGAEPRATSWGWRGPSPTHQIGGGGVRAPRIKLVEWDQALRDEQSKRESRATNKRVEPSLARRIGGWVGIGAMGVEQKILRKWKDMTPFRGREFLRK